MPFPLVPPPSNDPGALTWPRMLQRWLDDNPITRLTRTSTYIQLPIFNQGANTWNGYSDIVAAFNFEAPNNFSLMSFTPPTNPNYACCIAYVVGTTVVTRYLLWNATGSVLPGTITPYTNQVILKNFRLEIWNTNAIASEAAGVTIYTSRLGAYDYRYSSDGALKAPDTESTNFICAKSAFAKPPTTSISYWWQASSGMSDTGTGTAITGWIDQVNAVNFLPNPSASINVSYIASDPFYSLPVASIATGGYSLQAAGIGANPGTIAIAFSILNYGSTATIIDNGGGVNAALNVSGKITAYGGGATSNVTFSSVGAVPMLLVLSPNEGYCEIYNLTTGVRIDAFSGSSSTGPDGTIIIGTLSMIVWELVIYNNDLLATPTEYSQLLGRFFTKYGNKGYLLPLTFPIGSYPTTN